MNVLGVARGRWRLWRHSLTGTPGSRRRAPWLGPWLLAALGALVFAALRALFAALRAAGADATAGGAALGWMLTVSTLGLLVFDLHYALSALLLESDLERLRLAPLTPISLFALKLVDAFPRSATLLVALAAPAALAFGAVFGMQAWGWLLLPLQLLLLWCAALGAGVALALELTRRVPAARARDALSLLSTLALVLLWLANSFLLPRLVERSADLASGLRAGLAAGPALSLWNPGGAAAHAIAAAARAAPLSALAATAALALEAAVALGWGASVAARHLEVLQSRLGAPHTTAGARRRHSARWKQNGRFGALITRDALLLTRGWAVLGDVVAAAALWTLLPLAAAPVLDARPVTLARAMLIALSVGLGYEVAARAMPLERRALAWMALAPVAPIKLIASKLASVAIVALLILGSATAVLAGSLRLGAREWVELLASALPALAVSIPLGIWTGVAFGDPEWANPRAMLTLGGRLLASGLLVFQIGAWLGLLAIVDTFRNSLPSALMLVGPTVIALPLAALAASGASRSLGRKEWSL